MKISKLKRLSLIFMSSLLLISCQCKEKTKFTAEQQERINYLLEHEISLATLESMFNPTSDSNCVKCPIKKFCGISKDELLPLLKNYRDNDWKYSSPYMVTHNVSSSNVGNEMSRVNNLQYLGSSDPYNSSNSFDARFMDISIEEMENYLCIVKNSKFTSKADVLRFYYIKYGNNPLFQPDYANKHSLAMVPVQVYDNPTSSVVVNNEFTQDTLDPTNSMSYIYAFGRNECKDSPMANHNRLCPPFKGCTDNTMIEEIDR